MIGTSLFSSQYFENYFNEIGVNIIVANELQQERYQRFYGSVIKTIYDSWTF